jgi:hypothetical protein
MDTAPKSIIFNNYAQLSIEEPAVNLYANDPIVLLKAGKSFSRNDTQKTCLSTKPALADDNPIFGTDLDWAYREYIVHLLSEPGDGAASSLPLGLVPAQPISEPPRSKATVGATDAEQGVQHLYLFNVIVALEWYPKQSHLQQLQWAFRRASDFLYDVTDGFMALGQVVFGGPEMMDCADILIMASNRLLPRSWMSGMHKPVKYMPIRAGRGIWHKNNRVTLPWDEPESYRTLIHEWSHYALELPDEYLDFHYVAPAPGAGSSNVLIDVQKGQAGSKTVVVPRISLALQSIMSTLEGTSELVPQYNDKSLESKKKKVWEIIKDNEHFPFAGEHQLLEGPGQLPLPLPCFRYLGRLAGDGASASQPSVSSTADLQSSEGLWFSVPPQIDSEHCWVYLLRGPQDSPTSLIAQGTLDAYSDHDGFRLLGAEQDDTIVLIGQDSAGATVVLGNVIVNVDGSDLFAGSDWKVLTPDSFPMIDVLPDQVGPKVQIADIKVRVTSLGDPLPKQVWVFPLGDPAGGLKLDQSNEPNASIWLSASTRVPTLDGHVLLRWDDKLVISTFSQGGGPATNTPVGPPPISGGSSEGNVMLFFGDDNTDEDETDDTTSEPDHSDVRVVTTVIHGMASTEPSTEQARSYTFSLAGTKPLPKELNPTLIMYYDTPVADGEGDLLVYRQDETGKWIELPTYCRPGSSFAAVALNEQPSGGTLVADDPQALRVERYRLYWVPRGTVGG